MSSQSIVVDYPLAQPPAKVWRALTESDLLAAWLMANDFRAEVGHQFNFRAQPVPGWDGVTYCEVLVVDPPHELSYSWKGGSAANQIDTVVTFTLAPTETGGTLLKLQHSGFLPKDVFAFDNMGKGWSGHLADRLKAVVAKV